MAASMSTADSNLHALSAVLTRDVYDRYVRPQASERERTWVGRGIILVATLLALWLVHVSERATGEFNPFSLIAEMMLLAIAFACQLLPPTLDILFFRKGTTAGVIAGLIAGLIVVLAFTPLSNLFLETGGAFEEGRDRVKRLVDIGCCGFVVNVLVFALVSRWTRPLDPGHQAAFVKDLRSSPSSVNS
jgi:SSS family solute:Na+ symporter